MPRTPLDPVHVAVARQLRAHRVPRREPLLAAVSGGADSSALMHALAQLGQRTGVAHVHHELRGAEADRDLDWVQAEARALGLPVFSLRVSALGLDLPDASPEARSRELRYAALEQIRAREGYTWIATAHTLDDQAETVLLRVLRGTHLGGLAGIAPHDSGRHLLRPLLGVRRALLREYLRERGLSWREDATNLDRRVPRNALRADVLPLLERIQPGATEHLAVLADSAREWRSGLEQALVARLDRACRTDEGGLRIDLAELPALESPDGRALLAALLRRVGLSARVTRVHVERVAQFLTCARTGQTLSLPEGHVLARRKDHCWLGVS